MYIYLNPDKEEVSAIKKALKENGGYCPCRMAHTDDTKCMCKEFRESEDEGYCHCGLYYKAKATLSEILKGEKRNNASEKE